MQIQKFSKMKNGMYKVLLNDTEFEVHEDLILKYDLLLKKDISKDLLDVLQKENLKYVVYNLALKELKKKLRSEKELREILEKKGNGNSKDIDEVILLLRRQGYLNDSVYLESYIHDRILLSSDGPLKIQRDLLEKGLPSETICEKLQSFTEELETERVEKIVQKYLKQNRKSYREFCLKMKQILSRLGYHDFIISSVLQNVSIDEDDLRQAEYDKLYRKLSSKYQGKELEYKIRQKLFQKGFRV